MSSIDSLFTNLRQEKRKALMPFITAGDPDLAFTAAVVKELVGAGAHLFEIGIPYSDPIADGPVIQASYTRALAHKIKLDDILTTLGEVAPNVAAPLVTMVSYAIVYRHGLEKYVDDAAAAGIAGFIVPDLPVEESAALAKDLRALARSASFNSSRRRRRAIGPFESRTHRRDFCITFLLRALRANGPPCRRSWSTTSVGCARKRNCRFALASASASRSM